MWECVAAGLPIVVNERIEGGTDLIVLARDPDFFRAMGWKPRAWA